MDIKKVGATIAYLRKRAGFTQKDLADRIGISDKAVSRWERGLGLPDISYLRKLSILLDTNTDSLLAGETIHHDKSWQGVLILKRDVQEIGADTIIYDKPLISYLLSYFLLLGIKQILIICEKRDQEFISQFYEDGKILGTTLQFSQGLNQALETGMFLKDNCLVVYGRCILYGVDQTRFFQNAMQNLDRITILALPKKEKKLTAKLVVDADGKIVGSAEKSVRHMQYDYSAVPFLFCPKTAIKEIAMEKDVHSFVSRYLEQEELYVEMLDRGFVELPVNSWDEVNEASTFIRIVQDKCGMNVYCIEEVAWRRGLISVDTLRSLGEKKRESDCGKYILSLCERMQKTGQ